MRRWISRLFVLVLVGTLTGCWFPVRFDAEVEISRAGYYSFIFDGYLVDVELYDALREREITRGSAEEKEEIAKLKSDLERDPSASGVAYHNKGIFKLTWKREGDLLKTKSVTFLRRNEHIIGLSYNRDTGFVTMSGRSISRSQKNQIVERGLTTNGQLRVITDAKVTRHNATKVKDFKARGPRHKVYIWEINSVFVPTPILKIGLR